MRAGRASPPADRKRAEAGLGEHDVRVGDNDGVGAFTVGHERDHRATGLEAQRQALVRATRELEAEQGRGYVSIEARAQIIAASEQPGDPRHAPRVRMCAPSGPEGGPGDHHGRARCRLAIATQDEHLERGEPTQSEAERPAHTGT